jgi:gluconate 5-dehydrogenase
MEVTSLFSLAGRRALVTGSSRGIGLAIATAFCAAGAEVFINGRDAAQADGVARAIAARTGGRARPLAFDVGDAGACADAVDRLERDHGGVDILVNNAGVQRRGSLFELDEGALEDVLEVHVVAAFRLGRGLARGMCERGHGRIINISSILAAQARPRVAPYCAAKGALSNLTRAMAAEWGGAGVTANAIAPGYTRTDITAALAADGEFDDWLRRRVPLGRWGAPDDLAGAAVFLASPAAAFVNGHVLVVDGGLSATL